MELFVVRARIRNSQKMQHEQNNSTMMASLNAYRVQPGDTWDETDSFDVEMLTEFLLDDVNEAAGITIDFNMTNNNNDSHMVSSESTMGSSQASEDGSLSDFAAPRRHPSLVPIAPAPTDKDFYEMPSIASFKAMAQAGSIAKRRRFDAPSQGPILAVATGAGASMILSPQTVSSAPISSLPMNPQARGHSKRQSQVERRRERNRIIARRTRKGKKCFFEALKQEVLDLHRENQMLKDLVKITIGGEESAKLLEECEAESSIPEGILETSNENAAGAEHNEIKLIPSTFITADSRVQDKAPVVASDDTLKPAIAFCDA